MKTLVIGTFVLLVIILAISIDYELKRPRYKKIWKWKKLSIQAKQ